MGCIKRTEKEIKGKDWLKKIKEVLITAPCDFLSNRCTCTIKKNTDDWSSIFVRTIIDIKDLTACSS